MWKGISAAEKIPDEIIDGRNSVSDGTNRVSDVRSTQRRQDKRRQDKRRLEKRRLEQSRQDKRRQEEMSAVRDEDGIKIF